MAGSQQDWHSAIQDFLGWRMGARALGCGGDRLQVRRPFLPYTSIRDYLSDHRRVRRLLTAAFNNNDDPAFHPEVKDVQEEYSSIFCILLCIGKGSFINHFIQAGLNDQHLPFSRQPDNFPLSTASFFNAFYHEQWEFCAPIFKYSMDRSFDAPEVVLPIVKREELRSGGSGAVTHRIVLHPAYNQLHPDYHDQNEQTFVLKTYRSRDAEQYYKAEVGGFKRLRFGTKSGSPCQHVVGFYGSFVHQGTFNILLEHADQGTLEDYFKTTTHPSTGPDMVRFWRQLLSGCLGALMVIHSIGDPATKGPQILHGWHQDLKPANILAKECKEDREDAQGRISRIYESEFKVADLGLSHFVRKTSANVDVTDIDVRGTRTYGAPECSREPPTEESPLNIRQNVDIWSLGCVLSEAAVWAIRGYPYLLEYRRERKVETDRIYEFEDGDCFHNRFTVLDTVIAAHAKLVDDKSGSDYVTEPILRLIKESMLVEADARASARYLYHRSRDIIQNAVAELGMNSSEGLGLDRNPTFKFVARSSPPMNTDPHDKNHQQSAETSLDSDRSRAYPNDLSPTVNVREPDTFGTSIPGLTSNGHFPDAPAPGSKERRDRPSCDLPLLDPPVHGLGLQQPQRTRSVKRSSTIGPPFLSLDRALKWKETSKINKSNRLADTSPNPLPDDYLLGDLRDRDCAFLIDDALTMKPHWEDVKRLLGVLGYIVKSTDKDGFEVYFTMSSKYGKPRKVKDTTSLISEISARTPVGASNMKEALGQILQDYRAKFNKSKSSWKPGRSKSVRRFNLYILTDGVWQPDCDVEPMIRSMVSKLDDLDLRNAQIGIQFIQFGEDPEGTQRLEYLDSGLNLKKEHDIVDNEPFENGNIWKMLLGAINKWFDQDPAPMAQQEPIDSLLSRVTMNGDPRQH